MFDSLKSDLNSITKSTIKLEGVSSFLILPHSFLTSILFYIILYSKVFTYIFQSDVDPEYQGIVSTREELASTNLLDFAFKDIKPLLTESNLHTQKENFLFVAYLSLINCSCRYYLTLNKLS